LSRIQVTAGPNLDRERRQETASHRLQQMRHVSDLWLTPTEKGKNVAAQGL